MADVLASGRLFPTSTGIFCADPTTLLGGRFRDRAVAALPCHKLTVQDSQAIGKHCCRMVGSASVVRFKMKRLHSALGSKNWADCQDGIRISRRFRLLEIRLNNRANFRSIVVTAVALSFIAQSAFGQTTRTSPSSASTTKSIPSSSSTSPNSPCNSTNPTSPCYSAKAPRNPCYSAVAPNEPCSTTTTPNSQTLPPPTPVITTPNATDRAFTADQAKSQIEAEGFSNPSGLRKDAKGVWRGKATKDGLPVNVTLGVDGNVTAN